MEKYAWVKQTAKHLKSTQVAYQPEWAADKFLLAGKMCGFLAVHKNGRPIVTLKISPADGEILRGKYKDIVPGYYMNKQHWVSVYLDGAVPRSLTQKLVANAYETLKAGLPKKVRKSL